MTQRKRGKEGFNCGASVRSEMNVRGGDQDKRTETLWDQQIDHLAAGRTVRQCRQRQV